MDEGEAGERADHQIAAGEDAELALHAPDAHQHGGIDAVGLFRLGEPGAHVVGLGAAARDPLGRDCVGKIDPDRLDEFGLGRSVGDDPGIEGHAGEGGVEGRRA